MLFDESGRQDGVYLRQGMRRRRSSNIARNASAGVDKLYSHFRTNLMRARKWLSKLRTFTLARAVL
jgi:hypothetical protein